MNAIDINKAELIQSTEIEPEQTAVTEEEQIKDLLYQFYSRCLDEGFELRGVKKGAFADQIVRFRIIEQE